MLYDPWGAEMAIVANKWQEYLFGKTRTFKSIVYYAAEDTTDTLGLVRHSDVLVEGIGLQSRGWGDTFSLIWLKGAVINGILYGDTTNVTSISENQFLIPQKTEIINNYPNPFNNSTKITIHIGVISFLDIKIFDVTGKEVKRFKRKKYIPGSYELTWNGKNNFGKEVSSGLYFWNFESKNYFESKKILLLK